MHSIRPNFFAGPYIDRRADAREEADWPATALRDPQTLYVLARGTEQLVYTGNQPRIAFVTREHPALHNPDPHSLILLGWYQGARCVLVELADGQEVELGLTDSNSSCLIRSPGSSSARYVVMPMRL